MDRIQCRAAGRKRLLLVLGENVRILDGAVVTPDCVLPAGLLFANPKLCTCWEMALKLNKIRWNFYFSSKEISIACFYYGFYNLYSHVICFKKVLMIVKGIPCCCVWARLNASLIVLESGKEIDGNIDVCGMWANLLLPLEMLLVAAVAMLPLSLAEETMRRRCNLNKCPATENIEHNCLLLCFVLPCLVGFFFHSVWFLALSSPHFLSNTKVSGHKSSCSGHLQPATSATLATSPTTAKSATSAVRQQHQQLPPLGQPLTSAANSAHCRHNCSLL